MLIAKRHNDLILRKTRRGNILKTVREHYLRNDISNGIGTILDQAATSYLIRKFTFIL